MGEKLEGKIIKGIGGFYYVNVVGNGLYECRARGLFRNQKIKPLVGDMVVLETEENREFAGYIIEMKPRKNSFIRPAVANIDQAIIIFAAAQPSPNLNLLDRFTVMMEKAEIELLICFNKCDLVQKEEIERLRKIYKASCFQVCFVSAEMKQGIEEIKSQLKNKTTILAGPSGVGKSTMINLLVPNAHMETGQISKKIERGKHTTRHSELFLAEENTYLLDTPGFSTFYLEDIEANEVRFYFPEIAKVEGNCRFQGCVHIKEPDCRVKELLEQGIISQERYHNYVLLYKELKDKKKW